MEGGQDSVKNRLKGGRSSLKYHLVVLSLSLPENMGNQGMQSRFIQEPR